MIVIIGAGLSGMSCAYSLKKRGIEYTVLERSEEPGGLCRSYNSKGYTFDLAGHFLHLRTDKIRNFTRKLLGRELVLHNRRSSVRTHGVRAPFPFQAHLGALPPQVNLECLSGFIKAHSRAPQRRPERFDRWVLDTFGKGMARHFFFPYNSKFWKRDLSRILVDWTTWSIPRPNLEEVLRGALGMPNEGMGYNPRFYYPREGGMGRLAGALAKKVGNIRYGAAVCGVDARKNAVVLDSGEEILYRTLVSTMPLPALVPITDGIEPAIKRAARGLSWIAVDCVQLGIRRSGIFDDSWSYIPERKYPFCRVGHYPGEGKGARLYVEFTRRNDERFPGEKRLVDRAIAGLKRLGVLKGGVKIDVAHVVTLDPAYVVYDRRRRELSRIRSHLKRRRILTIGRYGAWEYSTMEDALLGGIKAAESL